MLRKQTICTPTADEKVARNTLTITDSFFLKEGEEKGKVAKNVMEEEESLALEEMVGSLIYK